MPNHSSLAKEVEATLHPRDGQGGLLLIVPGPPTPSPMGQTWNQGAGATLGIPSTVASRTSVSMGSHGAGLQRGFPAVFSGLEQAGKVCREYSSPDMPRMQRVTWWELCSTYSWQHWVA